jgi:hypothetical protein
MSQLKLTIGIIREGKVPPDKRVPLTPQQCRTLMDMHTELEIVVQPSPIRAYKDEEYAAQGIRLKEDLTDCDLIIGVKEVNIADLIPNKKFMFFSHTIKKQPYNRDLLKAIVGKNIELIDYEVLKDTTGKRIIGFGRYAGIVGCYNGFITLGLKQNLYELKPAHLCKNRVEVEQELKKVTLPSSTKIVLTGFGRVGHGAREIIEFLGIKEVSPQEFLTQEVSEPVFTHLDVEDYFERRDGGVFSKGEFYNEPELYKSSFKRFAEVANMYIPCHYWNSKADFIITREDLKDPKIALSVVADISCDIDGPVACTIRPSKIGDAIYGYNPETESEDDFMKEGVIAVMAVDNLPCELPLDASEDFGEELVKEVIPQLLNGDPLGIIDKATETTTEGALNEHFSYLQPFLEGKE